MPDELHYLGPIRPDRHPVTMGCSILPLPQARTATVPALVLLEEALAAMTGTPLCQQQLPLDGHPTPTALRCDLPAGHHSQEHYDRASGRVWLLPGDQPTRGPAPDYLSNDEPWPDHPA